MGSRKHNTLGFAVSMTLFTVFALFMMLVLLTGAASFGNVSEAIEERYSERTALFYISQKIRTFDLENGVSITETDGVQTLVLSGGDFTIHIYERDGYLTELYTLYGDLPQLRLGTRLLPAKNITFEFAAPSLFKATIDGQSIYVQLNAGGAS